MEPVGTSRRGCKTADGLPSSSPGIGYPLVDLQRVPPFLATARRAISCASAVMCQTPLGQLTTRSTRRHQRALPPAIRRQCWHYFHLGHCCVSRLSKHHHSTCDHPLLGTYDYVTIDCVTGTADFTVSSSLTVHRCLVTRSPAMSTLNRQRSDSAYIATDSAARTRSLLSMINYAILPVLILVNYLWVGDLCGCARSVVGRASERGGHSDRRG